MTEPFPTADSLVPNDDVVEVSGEIVREQTVRARVPVLDIPTEGTVRSPIPVAPEAEPTGDTIKSARPSQPPLEDVVAATEGTVRAPIPTAPISEGTVRAPIPTAPDSLPTVQEQTVRAPIPTAPSPLPATTPVPSPSEDGIPIPHSKIPTAPEEAAGQRRRSQTLRADHIPVIESEALEEIDPEFEFEEELDAELLDDDETVEPVASQSGRRSKTLRSGQLPASQRVEPAAVAGEVMVEAADSTSLEDALGVILTPTGPASVPSLPVAGGRRPRTEPGGFARGFAEPTGPQPVLQAETTGPHPVARRGVQAESGNTLLWVVAGALVLLAMAVVMFVATR
ncbi:MAG: hypothetical protein K0V04_16605 [Deltaproteobacteria bacterium]|nr:hypothetical protein [Deltaproteobacteria bacterium]